MRLAHGVAVFSIVVCLAATSARAADPRPQFEPSFEAQPTKPARPGPPAKPVVGPERPQSHPQAQAKPAPQLPSLYAGLGGFGEMLGRTSKSPDGSTSGFGKFYVPTLQVAGRFSIIPEKLLLVPWIAWTVLGSKSIEGGSRTTVIPIAATVALPVDDFDFKGGFASVIRVVSGSGGLSIQKNGTQETPFALPSGTSVSSLLALDLGVGAHVKRVRFDLDLLITGMLSARRAVDLALGVSYGIL